MLGKTTFVTMGIASLKIVGLHCIVKPKILQAKQGGLLIQKEKAVACRMSDKKEYGR